MLSGTEPIGQTLSRIAQTRGYLPPARLPSAEGGANFRFQNHIHQTRIQLVAELRDALLLKVCFSKTAINLGWFLCLWRFELHLVPVRQDLREDGTLLAGDARGDLRAPALLHQCWKS